MIFSFLNKPLPRPDLNKREFRSCFIVGSFVALFLIVFQPFQINEWQTDHKILKLIGFGFVSFIMPLILNKLVAYIIKKRSIEDNWTVGKEIIVIITILIFIAFGNLVYGNLLNIMPLTIKGFLFALLSVVLVGIFPVALHVLKRHNKLLKINLEQAVIVNKHLHPEALIADEVKDSISNPHEEPLPNEPDRLAEQITEITKLIFIAENEKDKIELFPYQLLYIEAADNYSNIVFTQDAKVKKQLIRSSLKRIESQIKEENIIRCHRTFIVNLKNVKNIEGNAAGYKLSFDPDIYFVPVSRSFGTKILEKLKSLK